MGTDQSETPGIAGIHEKIQDEPYPSKGMGNSR